MACHVAEEKAPPWFDHTAKHADDSEKPARRSETASPSSRPMAGENETVATTGTPTCRGAKATALSARNPTGMAEATGSAVTGPRAACVDRCSPVCTTRTPVGGSVIPELAGITTATCSPDRMVWPWRTTSESVVPGQERVQRPENFAPEAPARSWRPVVCGPEKSGRNSWTRSCSRRVIPAVNAMEMLVTSPARTKSGPNDTLDATNAPRGAMA